MFPGTKICIASATRPQANEVLLKITEDFCRRYGWGSANLRNEIKFQTIGANKAVIEFKNTSWIKVVTAKDSGRSGRANILICDEFRMVDKNTIDTVLKRFLASPRQPNYLTLPEYKDKEEYLEDNIEIYMSSCWYKSHWSFIKSKSYTVKLIAGQRGYFVCALPYQMAIKEGLLKRSQVEDEMSEADFDPVTWDMEMVCLAFGDTDGAFFTFDDVSQRRKLKTALYPYNSVANPKFTKIPDLLPNERRIMSVDIALMGSKRHNNDASSIIINSAIPNNGSYTGNIVYLENHEDITTDELALIIRRLFKWYKCTDLVIDTNGQGLGVYDELIKDLFDPETGELYPALSCCNDRVMADRCKVSNAEKVIWSIKANPTFNSIICNMLRSGFQNNKINLLINEFEADEILEDKIKGFRKLSPQEQIMYKMPYIQTTLLVSELIKLEFIAKDKTVKVVEKPGERKDRYSSLAYNFWVQHELELKLLREPQNNDDMMTYAQKIKRLNRRPNMY